MPQPLKCRQCWRGAPHAPLHKLGFYQGLRNILPLSPGDCLTSLGSSQLTFILSFHGSLNFVFLSPERHKFKTRCGGAHPQTDLTLGPNAERSSGTSPLQPLEDQGHLRHLFSWETPGFQLLIQLPFLKSHSIALAGHIKKLFVFFRLRIKIPTPV